MSLYELMVCNKELGGCGHARHRHARRVGETATGIRTGPCRTQGSDGYCFCQMFREKEIQNAAGNSAEGS